MVNGVESGSHEENVSPFQAGFKEGRAASLRKLPLSPYLRVGLDDYARGYRTGFFSRTDKPHAQMRSIAPASAIVRGVAAGDR